MITVNVSSNIDQVVRDLRAKLGPQALAAKIRAGLRAAKPEVKTVMAQETRRAFKVVKPQFAERAWRVSTPRSRQSGPSLCGRG